VFQYAGVVLQTELVCALGRLLRAERQGEVRRLLRATALRLWRTAVEVRTVQVQETVRVRLT